MAAPYTNIKFSDAAMPRIARATGYNSPDMGGFQQFLAQDPAAKAKYERFQQQAVGTMMAARGGVVKFVDGGMVKKYQTGGDTSDTSTTSNINLEEIEEKRIEGQVPDTATVTAQKIQDAQNQDVAAGTGGVSGQVAAQPSGTGVSSTVDQVTGTDAATITADQTAANIKAVTDTTTAEQSQFDATIQAQEQNESSVSKVEAAQGEASFIGGPANREIQNGELIDSVANAEKASKYTEQIQAATASPSQKSTVQGQLENLYSDFDAAAPPAWASGAMRAANSAMAARGLSASSLAGQAVVQATMEAAIPIAQADASIFATFEQTNLSNRQQRAMLAAQQRAAFIGQEFDQAFQARVANAARIADVANLNFNAEQQVILENSRIANTFELQNLSNKQALVMAEAASLSQLDMANLNNRQQAAVQNAQNFLQVDMANLSSRQQTTMFKAQSSIQSIFTDAAATNAARQFNATSQNQTDQFFAGLSTQVNQFNSSQSNAMEQFNIGQANAINQFNTNIANQRDQFNAQNQLVIAQSNAQWRRQIATADTAALNRQNEFNASAALGVSNQAYANIQQFTRDIMFKAIESSENALDRETRIATAIFNANASSADLQSRLDAAEDASIASAIGGGLSAALSFAGTSTGGSILKEFGIG